MQAASFPRVEAWSYSSVMATTNLRQAIEGLFSVRRLKACAALFRVAPTHVPSCDPRCLRRSAHRSVLGRDGCLRDRAGSGLGPRYPRDIALDCLAVLRGMRVRLARN